MAKKTATAAPLALSRNQAGEGVESSQQTSALIIYFRFKANGKLIGPNGGSSDDGDGGGIFNAGILVVTNSTFSGNQAIGGSGGSGRKGNGGAIFSTGTLTVTNCTFSANQASGGIGGTGDKGDGGGIFNAGTLNVINSTFSANQVDPGSGGGGINGVGGAIFNDGGTVNLKGTILAASGSAGNCGGGVTDIGYNISDDTTCNFVAGSGSIVKTPTGAVGLDPIGLTNNGGPTDTIALLATSPAVDVIPQADCTDANGDQLATDQRGMPRPDSGEVFCDIGAYEFQDPSFAGQPGTPSCRGKTVSALSQEFGTLDAAASALGYPSVKALQTAIKAHCAG